MNRPRILDPIQNLLSFAMAALLTTAVLFSLGAQADHSQAGALMAVQAGNVQQLCAAPARAARS